jgi:DNA processing protein
VNVTESLRQILALRLLKGMGPVAYRNGLVAFGSVDGILQADEASWKKVEGLHKLDRRALDDPKHWLAVDREIELAIRAKADIVTQSDRRYPALLKEIYDPPIILYVKGRLPEDSEICIAVVGSREASWQGLKLSSDFARDMAASGAVIVSGLARGIDTAAHRGALEAKGVTVAVLGNGLSGVYPPENKKLAGQITQAGAVVSEFTMDEPSKPGNFPLRNRIISGLSRAVLVVEARQKSGSLYTVDAALENGREVYVLPGTAGSARTAGSNGLLKQGAKLVTEPSEILKDLGFGGKKRKAKPSRPALEAEEKELLKLLKKADTLHLDEIVEQSALGPQKTMTLLTAMAVKGAVRELPGKYFSEVEA